MPHCVLFHTYKQSHWLYENITMMLDHIQIGSQENRKQEGHVYTVNTPTNTHAGERSVVWRGREYLLFLCRSDSGAGVTEAEERFPPLERTHRGKEDFAQKRHQ